MRGYIHRSHTAMQATFEKASCIHSLSISESDILAAFIHVSLIVVYSFLEQYTGKASYTSQRQILLVHAVNFIRPILITYFAVDPPTSKS